MAVDTQKFLALPPAKKGGSLINIKTKIVKASDILKGTLAAEKKQVNDNKKIEEQKKRKGKEEDLETPENKETKDSKKLGIKLPKMSWMDSVKNYIFTILFGWVAVRLLEFLPTLVKIVKPLASIADFLLKVGGMILNALVTFVDIGYKAYDWTRGAVKKIGGENAAKGFDSLMGHLNKVMNLVIALGLAASAMSGGGKKPKGPKGKTPKGKKPKWQQKLQKKWKKSALGKRVRNAKAFKKKTTRKIAQAIKPKNILKNLKKTGIGQSVTKNLDSLRNFKPQNIGKSKLFKNIQGFGSDLLGKGNKLLQQGGELASKTFKGVMNSLPDFNKLGKQLQNGLMNAYDNSAKWVQKRFDNVVDISKALKSKWDNALKGAGQAFNNMKAGAQQKIMEKVLKPVMEFLQPLIKRLKGVGGTIMKTLQKIPGFDQITKVLNKFGGPTSEGLLKKIGGKAIPIIGGIVNMGFAYDRLSKGDSIGGLIEGVSGLLDLSGLIGFAPGPGISMLMDGYMFARDFVPQIQQGEDAAIAKLGLSGFKSNIDNIFKKLPGIGEIVKMITGGDKKDKTEGVTVGKTTTTKIDRSNQPSTLSLLRSGKKGNIEQALYNMRLNASGGNKEGFNDWVGNKKHAKDVDLIMKHGLENVTITGGKVTLKAGSLPNGTGTTPINVSSVQKNNSGTINGVSKNASYENGANSESVLDGEGGNSGDTASETKEDGLVTSSSDGSGSLSESAALQYKKSG